MERVLGAREEYQKMMSLFTSNTLTGHSLLNPLNEAASASQSSAKVTQSASKLEETMNSMKQADPVNSTIPEHDLGSTSKSGYIASNFKSSMPHTSNAKNPRKSSHIPRSSSAILETEASTNAKISSDIDKHAQEYPDGDAVWRIEKVTIDSRQGTTPIFGWALATNGQKKDGDGMKCIYKYCLGVYKCAHCEFVERPRQQQREKRNNISDVEEQLSGMLSAIGEWYHTYKIPDGTQRVWIARALHGQGVCK
jgi:hypothetical protein